MVVLIEMLLYLSTRDTFLASSGRYKPLAVSKKTALRKLKINQKVDNPTEALSLNNIMLASSPRLYNLEVLDQLINNIDVNSIVTLEDVLAAECILEEIAMAMKSGVSASKQKLKIMQVEHLDQSHFVVRFLTMMGNLLQKVSLS